jgi:hypothetical protein
MEHCNRSCCTDMFSRILTLSFTGHLRIRTWESVSMHITSPSRPRGGGALNGILLNGRFAYVSLPTETSQYGQTVKALLLMYGPKYMLSIYQMSADRLFFKMVQNDANFSIHPNTPGLKFLLDFRHSSRPSPPFHGSGRARKSIKWSNPPRSQTPLRQVRTIDMKWPTKNKVPCSRYLVLRILLKYQPLFGHGITKGEYLR